MLLYRLVKTFYPFIKVFETNIVRMSNTRLGLVRCEHCGRQFNPHSGARHIPWCEKQQNETRKRRLSVEKRQALERYKWRISYRPSNQIPANGSNSITNQHASSQEQTRRFRIGANKLKKSSINSSTTLSSPSASSTTSIGTTSTANNDTQNMKLTTRQRSQLERSNLHHKKQQQQQPSTTATTKLHNQSARQTPVAQLKRSISSLTLTKQQGVWSSSATNKTTPTNKKAAAGSTARSFAPLSWRKTACLDPEISSQSGSSDATFAARTSQHNKHRTKSVNDLNNMSEIVETLAKRMDAIYAQNQALLASLSRGNSSKVEQLDHNRSLLSSDDEEDNGDDDDDNNRRRRRRFLSHSPREQDNDNDLNELTSGQVNCHHCKASCMKQANYCHKCGCKVYITTPNCTVTVSSESPG